METIKDFDSVAMMRTIRESVNNEIIEMSAEEMIKYFSDQAAEFEKMCGNQKNLNSLSGVL